MKKLREQIQMQAKRQEAKVKQERAKSDREAEEKIVLGSALRARDIRMRRSDHPPDLEDAAIHLSPDPFSSKSMLVFPVIFLYPMHNQSDLVKAFVEKDTIMDHFSYILPLPWDGKQEYKHDSVDCYMDTSGDGLVKVGKTLSLLQVLGGGKTVVVDGLVRIHVVPRVLAPTWVEEVRRKRGK